MGMRGCLSSGAGSIGLHEGMWRFRVRSRRRIVDADIVEEGVRRVRCMYRSA